MATVIKNGTIITACDTYQGDLLIEGEKITKIATKIKPQKGDSEIDAKGLEVYPGFIDVHTHLELPFMGTVSADDFESGSIAAACGGTTTFIDFAIPAKGQSLKEALNIWHKKAEGKTAVDYGFHIAIVEYNEHVASEIPHIINDGITSFKCFFAYKGAFMIDDGQFIEVLNLAKKHGALVSIHAENGEMLAHLMKELIASKKTEVKYHGVAHPAIAEGESIHRGAVLAKMAQIPLYIVHMSCNEGLEEVKMARSKGQMIFGETCPPYLLLSDDLYHKKGFEGAKWVLSPPLREKANNDKLWEGMRDGFIQVVATDHCSFNYKTQKIMGKDNFTKIPNGLPVIGDRVNLMYTYGVKNGKITRNQFAALLSANPAKIFGMYPKKGTIAVGSDADITIIDPKKKSKITVKTSHHNVDYSAFEGFNLEGMVSLVISRGKVIARDNEFLGEKNHGKFIKRKKFNLKDWAINK
jgi:dihydropyrimidinase